MPRLSRALLLCAEVVCAGIALCPCGLAQSAPHEGAAGTTAAAPRPEQRVDINHASLDELLKVPGLGKVWAARIVRFRPYRTKEDLLDKGVVTGAVYDRIKDFVVAHRDTK